MQCENPKILKHLSPIFDQGKIEKSTFIIGEKECQKYVFIPESDGVYERRFILGEGSVLRVGAIVLGANMVLKMSVSIEGSGADASIQLLGLSRDGSKIEIEGVGRALPGCQGVKLRIDQTNILLGEGAKISGRPVLEVATDSIEGGHSCKIHRISSDAIFYLSSHGIDEISAEKMLLEGEIMRHLNIVDQENHTHKEEIFQRLL